MPASSNQFRLRLLFIPLFILDALIATWHYFALSATLFPADYQRLIDSGRGWSAFIALEDFVGLFALILNATWFVKFGKAVLPKATEASGFMRFVAYLFWAVLGVSVALGCFGASFIAEAVAWQRQFKDSCNGFDLRVNLDVDSLFFQHLPTMKNFTMTFSSDPDEQIVQTYTLHVDPVYSSPLPGFYPSYGSITYDFPSNTYTVKSSNSTILRTGPFAFAPV